MLRGKKAFVVCLTIVIALIGTYLVLLDKSQFSEFNSASFCFMLQNSSNRSLDFSFFLYIGSGTLKFNNTNTFRLHGNFSVWEISDSSGIEVYCSNLAPLDYLSFRVERIKTTPLLQSTRNTELRLSFNNANESDLDYSGVLSILNNNGISVASRYYYTVRLNRNSSYSTYEDRTSLPSYLNVWIATITVFLIGLTAMLAWHKARCFPIVSVSILLITMSLYVFLGSGYEINWKNWWWLFPLSVFIHGYNYHINGNLFYFMILSILFESFVRTKGYNTKKDIVNWYLIPLFLPIIVSIPTLIASQQFGFGLSFSIEIMTWALWAYIIKHYQELIKNKINLLMAILSGIPSVVFLEWVFSYSFGYSTDPYDRSLAAWHIMWGIISGIGVLLTVFGQDIKHELKKAKIHLLCSAESL